MFFKKSTTTKWIWTFIMISEKEFVNHYTFYWNKIFPFSSRLVRKLNLQKEHFTEPYISDNSPESRSIINETSFRLFEKSVNEKIAPNKFSEIEVKQIAKKATMYIAELSKNSKYSICFLNNSELNEAVKIAKRTVDYIGYNIQVSPEFQGCSIINNCYGDIKSDNCIYEIKAGDRDFRVIDIRQLLVYSLLNYSSNKKFENIGLLNPRRGCSVEISLKEAIEMASGRGVSEVFNEILEFIDTSEIF